MLNHTLVAFATGYGEGRKAMASQADGPDTTDWCVGGCQHYSQTESGKARYLDLARRWEEQE